MNIQSICNLLFSFRLLVILSFFIQGTIVLAESRDSSQYDSVEAFLSIPGMSEQYFNLHDTFRGKSVLCETKSLTSGLLYGTKRKSPRWVSFAKQVKRAIRKGGVRRITRKYRKKKRMFDAACEALFSIMAATSAPPVSPAIPIPYYTCPAFSVTPLVQDFGAVPVQVTSAIKTFVVKNISNKIVRFGGGQLLGFDAADYFVTDDFVPRLLPGATDLVQVQFTPQLAATRRAQIASSTNACAVIYQQLNGKIVKAPPSTFGGQSGSEITLYLVGDGQPIPPTGDTVRINAGGSAYTDLAGNSWVADQNYANGDTYSDSTPISGTSDDVLYQTERYGVSFSYNIPITNASYLVRIHMAEIFWQQVNQRVFDITIEGQLEEDDLDIYAQAGSFAADVLEYEVDVTDGMLNLDFVSSINNAKVSAIEVVPDAGNHSTGHPFLHTIIDTQGYAVDYDGDGFESIYLDGSSSHTHEPGHGLVGRAWWSPMSGEFPTDLGSNVDVTAVFPVGSHRVVETIIDDNLPADDLSTSATVQVYPLYAVGGLRAEYYDATGLNLSQAIVNLPSGPEYEEVISQYSIVQNFGAVGGSPLVSDVVVRLSGNVQVDTAAIYDFQVAGGTQTLLLIDGNSYTGPLSLGVGSHSIEFRFTIAQSLSVLPAFLQWSVNGGAFVAIPSEVISNDQSALLPFMNSMPDSGLPQGGYSIQIQGLGFFPASQVKVHWGATLLQGAALTMVTPESIDFIVPAGAGLVNVQVETPQGFSNVRTFTYDTSGSVPFAFNEQTAATNLVDTTQFPFTGPTQGAWGPDGRFYMVTNSDGLIIALTFDDSYQVVAQQNITTMSGILNNQILGMAFNPADDASNMRLYIAHTQIYAMGGSCFAGSFGYVGEVSVLSGSNFQTRTSLISGLPTSNHDHGINGIQFDNSGNLLIAVGGNTNAGVSDCAFGGVPESPLSAAVLKAPVWKTNFNGQITYVETFTGTANNDQASGDIVDVAPGVDISVFASGLRNAYDIAFATNGLLYGSDNGPNPGLGDSSTSATTSTPFTTFTDDEVLLVREGHYYGHPNRNRGRYEDRQNVYWNYDLPSVFNEYTGPLASIPSSTDGVTEYRATTFNEGMRGGLLAAEWNTDTHFIELGPYGKSVLSTQPLNVNVAGLDVATGPGGALLLVDYTGNALHVLIPSDISAPSTVAYDIFPWRGNAAGGQFFTIGGAGFGTLGGTTVDFGGIQATVTSVSPTRIKGTIPANTTITAGFVDITVNTNGQTSVITNGFRYLVPPKIGEGYWENGPAMLHLLGEVSGAVLNGVLYLFGTEPGSIQETTQAYDLSTGQWRDDLAPRPFPGDHHAVEVVDGKIYLLGGLPNHLLIAPQAKVQIYDPVTDSWSAGSDIPNGGSGGGMSATIDGKIYYAGGIFGSGTVNATYKYDPATDSWTTVASMPVGRNHGSSATDGEKFYLFGGRDGGEEVSIGFDDVQIYDPQTDSWQWSGALGSTIPPLPQVRGGLSAAYLNGEFYVLGGETVDGGPGATINDVYDRADVFDPETSSWRLDATMITPRHGLAVIATDGKLFTIGGGTENGNSQSTVMEILHR